MGAMSRRHTMIALFLACVAGTITLSAAVSLPDALSAKLPMPDLIRWDPIKQVWVDMKTGGVVTVTSNSVTNPAPGTTVAAAPTYTQQGETRPQRWSDKSFFPLVIPDAEWFKTCGKIQDDPLTHIASKCDIFKDVVNCQQLAEMGYLPSGVQSFVPGGNLNGGFQVPNGCSSGNLGVEYDGIKMVFNSPQIPILAVIAKDLPLSRVYYFGSGVTQGRLMNIIMLKAEFCYAPPNISPLYVSKTATYSTGMQPGTAAWSFFKTVALAPPFSNNVAAMFKGDSADATWTLSVQKTGTDTVYQGAVNGQITITNPQNAPVTVYNINDYVQGGPQSTVSCGSPVPFQIQPCSSTVCNYVGYWPSAPTPGSYTNLADVQYSVGSTAIMGNQVGTSIFQVAPLSAAVGMINTAAGAIPAGQAVVQDAMAPQAYGFSGTSQQSYSSQLTCPDTAILTNQAVLTASTGQQITQTATVQKLCYELAVRVAQTSAPFVGRWEWTVSKIANVQNVTLKPAETAWDRYVKQQLDLAQAAGQDTASAMNMITGGQNFTALTADAMPGSTNEEVTYTVTFTRNAPQALAGNTPAFQSMGEVYITNSSPLNAQLQEVQVSMTNPFGGLPYTTTASCPMLTVAAGQTLTCRYIATPSFNPVGASVAASAIYLNNRNGVPTGATTAFTSASIMVGAAAAAGAGAAGPAGRKLQAATSGGGDNRANNTLANMLSNILKPASSTTSTSLNINNMPPIPIPNLPDFPNISGIISAVGGNGSRSSNGSSSGFSLSKFMSDVAKNLAEDSKKDSNSDDEQIDVTITPKSSSSKDAADAPADAPAPAADTTVAAAAATGNPSAPPQMPQAPVVAAAPAAADLKGLQQECVNVSDVFVTADDYVTGMLVAGTFPSGKICSTTTFTYTVRYGPFKDCFTKEATNKASWVAADTQQAGNASSTINLSVVGCGAAVAAKAKSYAVWAKKSYSWAVQKKISTGTLTVAPDQIAKATYTIDYTRTEILVNPKLSTTLQFDNLAGTSAVTLSSFSFTVTSLCDGQQRQKTGTFKCAATTIPAGGAPLTCQVQTDLPCVGPGVIVAQALAKDKTITSVPFNFPAPKSIDTLAESECAIVVDEFSQGTGLVSGNLTSGVRPYGKLCGSKQFAYTVSFGPFNACGKQKATNVASLTTGAPTTSARADATLTIDVSGCEVYTPIASTDPVVTEAVGAEVTANATANMRLGAPSKSSKQQQQQKPQKPSGSKTSLATGKGVGATNCVSSVAFWKGCMLSGNLAGRCAVVLKLPTGPHTAFFPAPQSRVVRTYKAVLGKGTNSGIKSTDQWFKAAQAVAATQLNELAGVALPGDVRNALSLAGAAVGVSTTVPPVLATELQGVSNAVALLEKFSTGQAGVKQC